MVKDVERGDQPGDLADWADEAGASERTLARLFQKQAGMTFGAWRQRRRLQAAIERLAAGDPVATVALDLGYDSPSAFITMFRKTLGDTPDRYLVHEGEPARSSLAVQCAAFVLGREVLHRLVGGRCVEGDALDRCVRAAAFAQAAVEHQRDTQQRVCGFHGSLVAGLERVGRHPGNTGQADAAYQVNGQPLALDRPVERTVRGQITQIPAHFMAHLIAAGLGRAANPLGETLGPVLTGLAQGRIVERRGLAG